MKSRKKLTSNESEKIQSALADIEDTTFSDAEVVGFYELKQKYLARSKKRARGIEEAEATKRKVSSPASRIEQTY